MFPGPLQKRIAGETKLYVATNVGTDKHLYSITDGVARQITAPIGGVSGEAAALGDVLFFVSGKQLFRTNGDELISVFQDIVENAPLHLTPGDQELYFAGANALLGRELWKVGLTGPSELVKDINPEANPATRNI